MKIIVWGNGKYYRYKAEYLKKNYEIVAFVSKNIQEKRIDDYPVIQKEELQTQIFDKIVVMSSLYFLEIISEILELGIESSKIELGINLPPATEKEAQYISEEVQLAVREDGKVIWNGRQEIACLEDIKKCIRLHQGFITDETIENLPVKPLCYDYGISRGGHSIARYYIDAFVREYKDSIQGTVMEIGDGRYTKWGKAVEKSLIMILDEAEEEPYIKGNLETGEGMQEETIDCFVLTNVFTSLFDLNAAISNVGKALKKGGKAIITVAGIASLCRVQYETYGQFWRFTPASISRLLRENIPGAKITVKTFGNVKTSAAFLYGMTVEDLTQEELDYRDSNYPMVIGAYVEKC